MIYLICAQDAKQRISEVSKEEDLNSSFWKYVLKLTEHRNFLYSYSFYTKLTKQVLLNRVNVIFTNEGRRSAPHITNAINCSSLKQILVSYKNNNDDVYILGDRNLIELFAIYADYLIIYKTNDITRTQQSIQDTINFADYSILSRQEIEDATITHFVRVPNFLHK